MPTAPSRASSTGSSASRSASSSSRSSLRDPALLQRLAALAAVALVAALVAIALTRRDNVGAPATTPVRTPGATWSPARVALLRASRYGKTTSCGLRLTRETTGVAHPYLPCGAKLIVSFRGRSVGVRVVDSRVRPGDDFDVTASVARRLGLTGVETVRWRFSTG